MKTVIAFICLIGIAVVSSAPVENEAQAADSQQEGAQERAAEIPQNLNSDESAAVAERAAETPEPFEERAASRADAASSHEPFEERAVSHGPGIQERGMFPSPREIIAAVEDKYLTPDGKALLKSFVPIA